MGWPYWGAFFQGLLLTLGIVAMSYSGALVLGSVAAMLRISPIPPLRIVSSAYVEVVRNIPALAILFIAVFGLPEIGVTISLFWSVVLVLTIYEGAFVCEALRTGINSVNVGTAEAARALGLRTSQVITRVIMPQALRSVVQPQTNVFIQTVINSSLAAVVGLADLTGTAQRINIREAEPLLFFGVGLAYVALALLGGRVAALIERKVRFAR